MKPNIIICLGLIILLASCSKSEEFDYNSTTDTFLLVDCYNGVYKFVQIDNEYTIGVDEGILDIPADFIPASSEDVCFYYLVDLKYSNFADGSSQIIYQRFCQESSMTISKIGSFEKVQCSVARIPLQFGDYLYKIQSIIGSN